MLKYNMKKKMHFAIESDAYLVGFAAQPQKSNVKRIFSDA